MQRERTGMLCTAVFALFFYPAVSIGAAVSERVLPKPRSTRPQLFYTPETIERVRERIRTSNTVRDAWESLHKRADKLLAEKLVSKEYAETGRGQHGNYQRPSAQVSTMGPLLGLAYVMTGEKRYAEKLEEALLHFGTFDRWAGDAGWDPPWRSELNTARFCYGYAVGYDAIHGFLSEKERSQISDSMIRLGIMPTLNDWIFHTDRIHALDSMGHNWWSVCVSMAGLAALSLAGDVPAAEKWVAEVSDAFPEWFYYAGNVLQNKSINFDRHGAFYESVGYANYALSEYLIFRRAWKNVFPDAAPPHIPLLETAGDFFIHTSYPSSDGILSVNFGDSSLHSNGARTIQYLLANGISRPEYRWYLERTSPGLNDPVRFLYYPQAENSSLPDDLPRTMHYPDIGWCMQRSSWRDDATLLAVKSGYAWNHAHPDSGSFILFHGGKPLFIDSGNCSYSRREYTTYYRHSRAHNVVLFNGQGQLPEDCGNGDRGVVTPGTIPRCLDACGLRYVLADATGPTAWHFSRNYRHFLWLGDVVLIVDDLRTHEAGEFSWLLHYAGEAERTETGIEVSNGDKCKAHVRTLFPEEITVSEERGLKDHDPGTEAAYYSITSKGKTRSQKFLTAIVLDPQKKDAPHLEKLKGEDMSGVRITTSTDVTDVFVNLRADGRKMHRNSCNTIAGWETDAFLFAVTRSRSEEAGKHGARTRYFLACGSYLRKEKTVFFGSLSKAYTVFAVDSAAMEIALSGQPLWRASFHAPARPRKVLLAGTARKFQYDAGRRQVILQQSDSRQSKASSGVGSGPQVSPGEAGALPPAKR